MKPGVGYNGHDPFQLVPVPAAFPTLAPVTPFRPGAFPDLVAGLRFRARTQPDQPAFIGLDDGETPGTTWTYAELDQRARAVASHLVGRAKPGDRALLLYPPGLPFVAAYWGCLYAGLVPAPVYPPRDAAGLPGLLALADDAEATLALTTQEGLAKTRLARWFAPAMRAMNWLATDDMVEAAGWEPPALAASEGALLQYTSGSTSAPRGVRVSHANLLANAQMLQSAWAASGFVEPGPTRFLTWLPMYHDMGLIGMVVVPVLMGATTVVMSPLHFLQKPERWLRALSAFRAEVSAGPNFAYALCTKRASAEGLDLSGWRVAMNGAEPVRAETLDDFAKAFAATGFRSTSFYPCYGLAEATLFVTGGLAQAEPIRRVRDGRTLLGCGRVWGDTRLRVTDPRTGLALADGSEGEVWVSGPGVAQGYWKHPSDNFDVAADGARWLRTGDLGFVADGELFVTGRLKDLIILRGRNVYPQDVEHTAASAHRELRPGCGAAFAVEVAGEERLVLVQEVDRAATTPGVDLTRAVRRAVAEAHDAALHDVVLLAHGGLPKTSSGKVRRGAAKDAYQSGTLKSWKGPPA